MNYSSWHHILQQFNLPFSNPILIFLVVLVVTLVTPLLMEKIKVPAIVGFIVAGITIGPYGFNLLGKHPPVEIFFTIGLLYIMFIAGIDLDLAEFKKIKYKSLSFGSLTFLIPILIGFPVCYYALGYPLITSILTSGMFATHTLVAYPIVNKYGVSKNEIVAVTAGGTILTDSAVLVIFAVILGSKDGTLNIPFWLQLAFSITVFAVIMFLLMPRIAKWFFTQVQSGSTAHYVFVLGVVFFSAFLSQLAGLEPIIGAFVAGLAINRLIPHSSALMDRLKFAGNAIFIPSFLISVGMLVDLHVLLKGTGAVILAVSLTIVALAGKWLSAFVTQKIFNYSIVQRQLMFGLSSSHAAATMAIILIAYKAGIIDDNILNGTVILIMVTCMVASFATERASRKIAISQQGTNGK